MSRQGSSLHLWTVLRADLPILTYLGMFVVSVVSVCLSVCLPACLPVCLSVSMLRSKPVSVEGISLSVINLSF